MLTIFLKYSKVSITPGITSLPRHNTPNFYSLLKENFILHFRISYCLPSQSNRNVSIEFKNDSILFSPKFTVAVVLDMFSKFD